MLCGVQICYKEQAEIFSQVKCLREEQKGCIKIWSMEDDFAILPTGFRKSLINLSIDFSSFRE